MCYDISFTTSLKQLSDYFPELVHDDQIAINFQEAVHIAGHAYGLHPVIYKNRESGALHLKLMEWGCIPYYIKEEAAFLNQRATMLNARSERILDDPKSYWYKIRNRRCLVPITAFYEHRSVTRVKKKVPYLISLKDQPVMFIPGLYSVAKFADEHGELHEVFTFTLVTRAANSVMAQIHNSGDNSGRMPLMLPVELSKKWLELDLSEEEYREILNYEMPSQSLKYHTVYTIRSSKLRPDNKGKHELFNWGNIPEISL